MSPISSDPLEIIDSVEIDDELDWRARERRRERCYHAAFLFVSAGVLLVACLLHVRRDQRVAWVFAPDRPLPELCQMKVTYGLDCPGCGLTRCFVHAVRGRLSAASDANSAGLLLVLLIVSQLPYRLWMLVHPGSVQWSTWELVLLLAVPPTLLLVQWTLRLAAS